MGQALVCVARWGVRADQEAFGPSARDAETREELISVRGRELEAVAATADALARTADPEATGRGLLDQVGSVLGLGFTALALIDEAAGEATGLVARDEGQDVGGGREIPPDLPNH